MILPDTSVWADHFRNPEELLLDKLAAGELGGHPFVLGELALGYLRRRDLTIAMLRALPQVPQPGNESVLDLIESAGLAGRGIGLIDAHLLASARAGDDVLLWTRDKRLRAVAAEMKLLAAID